MIATAGTALADPLVSSSIYCHGHLDELLHRCIAPLWRRLRAAGVGSHLWLMRYSRCGEHLKVRFHGAAAEERSFRDELTAAVTEFLAGLPGAPAAERPLHDELFPVDPEDLAAEPYPDRSLRWTTYRRQPGTMGREPLSDDLELAVRFTRCLGAGCEHVLGELIPDSEGRFGPSMRLRVVHELLVAGPAVLGFPAPEAARYLRYHRDWLILGAGGDLVDTHGVFEAKVCRERPDVERIRRGYERVREHGAREQLDGWAAALRALLDRVCRLASVERPWQPEDAYERDQVLAPLFKSLHGLANLVRVGLFNEAYLCHVVAESLDQGGERCTRSRC